MPFRCNSFLVVIYCLSLLASLPVFAEESALTASEWTPLFNGQDLEGWVPKIRGYELGENYAETFRVEDGLLKVAYDKYEGDFKNRFGHLFYKKPFSRYVLRVEYRIVGEYLPGTPRWAIRNSGVMLHGQMPESMLLKQDFPVSLEAQLLGGDGENDRTNANLCTPGTNVVMDDKLVTRHCISAESKTYHGEQWVTIELEVDGSRTIRHKLEGKTVIEYSQPQLDEKDKYAKELLAGRESKRLDSGTISLQSEGHPVEFRKVEIKVLGD